MNYWLHSSKICFDAQSKPVAFLSFSPLITSSISTPISYIFHLCSVSSSLWVLKSDCYVNGFWKFSLSITLISFGSSYIKLFIFDRLHFLYFLVYISGVAQGLSYICQVLFLFSSYPHIIISCQLMFFASLCYFLLPFYLALSPFSFALSHFSLYQFFYPFSIALYRGTCSATPFSYC